MRGTVGAVREGKKGEGEGTYQKEQKEWRGQSTCEKENTVLPQQGCNNRCVFVSIIEDVHRSIPI